MPTRLPACSPAAIRYHPNMAIIAEQVHTLIARGASACAGLEGGKEQELGADLKAAIEPLQASKLEYAADKELALSGLLQVRFSQLHMRMHMGMQVETVLAHNCQRCLPCRMSRRALHCCVCRQPLAGPCLRLAACRALLALPPVLSTPINLREPPSCPVHLLS